MSTWSTASAQNARAAIRRFYTAAPQQMASHGEPQLLGGIE